MIYYKAKLHMAEPGMQVQFKEFHQIHETECYSYCVDDWNFPIPQSLKLVGETDIKAAKRRGIKIHRIHKTSSRVAFDTKEKAFNQLVFLKRRQINHMKRDVDLFSYFLDRVKDDGMAVLKAEWYPHKLRNGDLYTLPDSTEKISRYYVFD